MAFKCNYVICFQYFEGWVVICAAALHFASTHQGFCGLTWPNVVSHHARASGRQNDVRARRSHRVSSSCGAKLLFGVVVVFVCFICGCIFKAPFSSFEWVVFFVCCKKHVLPLACIFSTDFQARQFFQWLFFGGLFQTFDSVEFLVFVKSMSYLQVAFFSTDF